jgi:hypothetical protein
MASPSVNTFSPPAVAGGHLGMSAMLDLLERLGWNHRTTTLGVRHAFKTWATERTNCPGEVGELCLSHVQGDALERAYQRGDSSRSRAASRPDDRRLAASPRHALDADHHPEEHWRNVPITRDLPASRCASET